MYTAMLSQTTLFPFRGRGSFQEALVSTGLIASMAFWKLVRINLKLGAKTLLSQVSFIRNWKANESPSKCSTPKTKSVAGRNVREIYPLPCGVIVLLLNHVYDFFLTK